MARVLLSLGLVAPCAAIQVHTMPSEDLLPWDQARQKAEQTLKELSAEEKHGLVHGSNSYAIGWYVGNTAPIDHLNIPALTMQDAGNGFRPHLPGTHGSTTMWPSGLALAATWDENICREVGAAMGREFRGKGSNVMLGPSVNVHRIARNGRNFEYMSGEDPYLGSRLVKPFVQGVQSEGVIATAKHYAFNEQETNRGTEGQVASSSVVDSRTAWELYYPPFAAAVEAGVGAFMCSYNRVNGTQACENEGILKSDLKGTMGFQGFVMSDWGATHSTWAVSTGLDQDMPGGGDSYFGSLELAHSYGKSEDEAVLRILSAIYHVRLDQRTMCKPPACLQSMLVNVRSSESSELARRAAAKSIALLKNDGLLPLEPSRIRKLVVLGSAALAGPSRELMGVMPDYYAGGGSGHVSAKKVVTPADGIRARAERAGIEVSVLATDTPELTMPTILKADAIVIVGATTATEGMDRSSLHLDGGVDHLIEALSTLRPTAVLMQTPGAILTPWRNNVSAIANMFLGGEETGNAWASVLFGDEPPAGKLPIMMPATDTDIIEPEAGVAAYAEGLFTSYRSPTLKAAFPFGHGLSYTSFTYGPATTVTEGCKAAACVRLTVTNSGSRAGVETPQAYVHFPPELKEPELVLRGFHKTRLLQPGDSEEILFQLSARDLSTFDVTAGGWVQRQGAEVRVGSSSADLRQFVAL